VSVRRGDPLGLFERAHDRRQAVDLYVHPQTTALEGLSLGHLRDLEGLPVQHLARDDVSFHALREYQPGDDLRHVHWKSTARVGEVMVRQYEETRRSHFVVGLSTLPDEYREAAEFELAISVAGSIGLRALRDSRVLDARTQQGRCARSAPVASSTSSRCSGTRAPGSAASSRSPAASPPMHRMPRSSCSSRARAPTRPNSASRAHDCRSACAHSRSSPTPGGRTGTAAHRRGRRRHRRCARPAAAGRPEGALVSAPAGCRVAPAPAAQAATIEPRVLALDLTAAALLLAVSIVGFAPTFDSPQYLVAGVGGLARAGAGLGGSPRLGC
jgi:hypothetical protein